MFGINTDPQMGDERFEYLIADIYNPAAGYCVEMFDAPDKYSNGTNDENYYSEVWIPIKKTAQ